MTNSNMTATEARIVDQLLSHAFSHGYIVSVNDGEEWVVKLSANREEIINALASTDSDTLVFRDPSKAPVNLEDDIGAPARVGSVTLIWGNEDDLISDHTDNEEITHLVDHQELTRFNNRPAIVVVTIHSGDNSRAIFGPFASGTEASHWGFRTFPDRMIGGHSVTWCWEDLVPSTDNVFDAIIASIN